MPSPAFVKRVGKTDFTRPALVTEYLTATEYTTDWANLTGWTTTGVQVSSNRLYGIAGGNPAATGRAFAATTSEIVKITAEIVNVTGNAGTQYVGVNFGGTNNGVNASLPNFVGVGIGTTNRRPVRFVGGNFTTVTTGNAELAAVNLAAGTYRATVVVDAQNVSILLQTQDGTTEYSETFPRSYAPNSGAITSIIAWNGATNGLSGSYVKALGAKIGLTPFRTKTNTAGTIEGNTPFVIRRNDGDRWRIQLPKTMNGMKQLPVVVFFHQATTGSETSPMTEPRWVALRQAFETSGYILLSANDGGDRWGNSTSVANYAALLAWVRARVHCGKVFLLGCSMGGLPMLNTISHKTMYPIAAAMAICPVCDLIIMRSNGTFTAAIDAAWGSSSEATLIANSAGYDPMTETPSKFRRIPYLFNVGASDTIVPAADHTDLFEPIIAPYAVSTDVNVIGTGHLQTGQYDPLVIMPFFDAHLG